MEERAVESCLKEIESWNLLIVDDDQDVIESTKFVLEDVTFLDKPLSIISANSKEEALKIFEERDDIAVALIDIIMESENAGLELIKELRMKDSGKSCRLIVRTGQPGIYPEDSIFFEYDIHQYLEKADLSSEKLIYTITSALRSYFDLLKISFYATNLEELVKERTQELATLNSELEERVKIETEKRIQNEKIAIQNAKMAAMGEMLGAITHQWRQPLGVIPIVMDVVLSDFEHGELTEEKLTKHVDMIHNRIDFLSQTMNDFRMFFKPNKEKQAFFLKKEVEKIVELMCPSLEKHRIGVTIDMDEKLAIRGYQNEIKQVALNLINNAKDAIVAKNVTDGKIAISAKESDGKIIIEFQDNGGGIDAEIEPQLFEKFATSKGDEGTGVGLNLSKAIIEEHHGGKLEVENREGGACFRVVLDSMDFGSGLSE